jgi:outer membrane receptor protein involved in Fe transport
MRLMLLTAAGLAAAGAVHAQEPAAAAPAAVQQAPAQGVIVYRPEAFADQRPSTAMDMVLLLPGFSFEGGDNVRGFAGAAGNVLIDGERPASKTDNLQNVLTRIPVSQVERIEIIRGGAPGIDMQGKTVLANVVRKKEAAVTGVIAASATHLDDGRMLGGFRLEGARRNGDKNLEGSLVIGGGLDDGAGDGPRVLRDASGAVIQRSYMDNEGDGVQVQMTGAYETPLLGGKVRANAMFLNDRFAFDAIDRIEDPAPAREVEHDLQKTRQGEVGLRYNRSLGPRTTFEAVGLQQLRSVNLGIDFAAGGSDSVFSLDKRTGESIARGVVRFTQSDKLSFESGGEVAYNWLLSKTGFSIDGTPVSLPAANVRVEEKRGEAFGTATWRPSSRFTLEAGLRVEASKITSEGDVALGKTLVFPKPRAVFTWTPNENNQVRFRVEREVGQLNFNDFVASANLNSSGVQAGNPDLNPEQAWVAEASYERRFWKDGAATVTLRRKKLTDVIDRAPVAADTDGDGFPDTVFDQPANIGSGASDEVEASLNLPLDRLFVKNGLLRGEATWTVSEVTDPTTGETRRISGQRPVNLAMHFTQGLPKWNATWGVDLYGSWRERYWRYNEIDTFDLGNFMVLFGEYRPRKDLTIRAEARNLGLRPFTQTFQVYGGPRSTDPLAFTDRRDMKIGPQFYVRLRKTWG